MALYYVLVVLLALSIITIAGELDNYDFRN